MIVVRQMNPARRTDKRGKWSLRHVILEPADGVKGIQGAEVHAFVTSKSAPTRTLAADLEPGEVEFLGLEDDEMSIPISTWATLVKWPPS